VSVDVSFSVPISCDNLRSAARDLEGASDLSTLSWELLEVSDAHSLISSIVILQAAYLIMLILPS
jgi:hypothetical protein